MLDILLVAALFVQKLNGAELERLSRYQGRAIVKHILDCNLHRKLRRIIMEPPGGVRLEIIVI